MLFDKPILFEDAVRSAKAKALLPTTLTSAELSPLRGEVAQNALASARVFESSILQSVSDAVQAIISPVETEGVIKGFTLPEAREKLRAKLKEVGYSAPEGEQGRITDLSSEQRLNLMLQTQVDLNRGFGQFVQGQDDAVLDVYPAQELYRAEPREEPRIWNEIWPAAAAKVDEKALHVFKATGRMVALKDSPIWMEISDFGLPYPPFKFNSGMKVEDVERDEALKLGLMTEETKVKPIAADYKDSFEMSADGLTEDMKLNILHQLGPDFTFKDGVLTRK